MSHCLCPPACVSLHLPGQVHLPYSNRGFIYCSYRMALEFAGESGPHLLSATVTGTCPHSYFQMAKVGKGIWRGGGEGGGKKVRLQL